MIQQAQITTTTQLNNAAIVQSQRQHRIRLAIIESDAFLRRGMIVSLDQLHRETISVLEFDCVEDFLLQKGGVVKPNAVIVNRKLLGLSIASLIKDIRYCLPSAGIGIYSDGVSYWDVNSAFRGGADGYISRSMDVHKLASFIFDISNNTIHLDTAATGAVTKSLRNNKQDKFGSLSPREQEVMLCAAMGYSNDEIAQKLGISVKTVKTHISTVLIKLSVRSRTHLALYAINIGLLSVDSLPAILENISLR